MERWEKKQKIKAYQGAVMEVYKEPLIMPNGKEVVYDFVHCKGGACVLPIDEDDHFILIRQYRNTLDEVTYEIPGGCYDYMGEEPLQCAMRELEEEIGIKAKSWYYLSNPITCIGVTDERCAIFIAQDLSEGIRNPDPEEFIDIVRIHKDQALKMVMHGEIVDAKTVIAIMGYHLKYHLEMI